jgi:hypothetical protein
VYAKSLIDRNTGALERALGLDLRPYSMAEVEEMAYRMKDIEWVPGQVQDTLSDLPDDIQEYVMNELAMSKLSFRYWCERYCKVLDDKGRVVPLVPWPSQEYFLSVLGKAEEEAWDAWQMDESAREFMAKIPLILLKSRQIGGTVISEALLAHLTFFFKNARAVIASDHPDNSGKLWQVLLRMYDNLPGWMKPTRDAKVKATNLHLDGLDSDVQVGSGNQKTTLGQGMTVDAAHLTEVSTWAPDNAFAIDEDLKPAFNSSRKHHSLFVIESTGQGGKGNWFHDQFQAARTGNSQFKALFIGWFMCPDKWSINSFGTNLTPETISMGERLERELNIKITKDQLAWYQREKHDYAHRNLLELFYQEYPSTPEEAFQTGYRSVFSIELRSKVRNECRTPVGVYDINYPTKKLRPLAVSEWVADTDSRKWDNRVIIWENPRPGFIYVLGADVSYGLDGKDNGSAQVLRVGNRWAEDEQVAEWCGNVDPINMTVPIWILGHIYQDKVAGLPAKVAVECNPGSPGIVTQTELMRQNYPYFYVWTRPLRQDGAMSHEVGWWTTPGTRPLLIEKGVHCIENSSLRVNSPFFVDEMASFVHTYSPTGMKKVEHAPGAHDDRIMALFIALYVAHESDSISIAEERTRLKDLKNAPKGKIKEMWEVAASWKVGENYSTEMEKLEQQMGIDGRSVFY